MIEPTPSRQPSGDVSKTAQRVEKLPGGPLLSPIQGLKIPVLWCFGLDFYVFWSCFGRLIGPTTTFSTGWNVFGTEQAVYHQRRLPLEVIFGNSAAIGLVAKRLAVLVALHGKG